MTTERGRELEEWLANASRQYPTLPNAVAQASTERVADDPYRHRRLADTLEELAVTQRLAELKPEVWLVWACLHQQGGALTCLEREFFAPAVRAVVGPGDSEDELWQALRGRVLLPRADGRAVLSSYNGRGPLLAWLRMMAKRLSIDLWRGRDRALDATDGDALSGLAQAADPEIVYLKQRYATVFNRALEQALTQLEAREAAILKLSYVDGLGLPAVARLYSVSTRTVQRWLSDIKEKVLARTRELVRCELTLAPRELESLMGLVQSQLHVTLHRVLR